MINLDSNRYLDSTSAGVVNANIGNGGGNQNWIVINAENGYFYLQNQITLRVLEVLSNGSVVTSIASLDDRQKWYSPGNYIINKSTGKYLESSAGNVFASTFDGEDSQKWNKQYLA